jgi:uncharacterized repeat protein (TIGR04076 family)
MSDQEKGMIQNKNAIGCDWHPKGTTRDYSKKELYPNNICPWLYYATYPYMLGLLYGADYRYNKEGDAWVSCPAKNGCKALVRKRPHPGVFDDPRIAAGTTFVIYTEVLDARECPMEYKVGEKFIFPTVMKKDYACPAAWFNAFPFMEDVYRPPCLDTKAIACPDWKSDITINVTEGNKERKDAIKQGKHRTATT